MAQPTNTYDTYAAAGLREDLSDVIYRIDPTDVPFTSNIGRSKASAKYHEWQIQNLAAARDDNARIEGDDATNTQVTPAIRVGNRTQISDKVAQVTGTLEAVDKAGRDSEMEYQVLLKGLELKRDVEKQMLSNKPSVAGSSTTASQSAGFESWLTSNVSRGTGGLSGGFSGGVVNAPTDGTARTFTETLLKSVLASCFSNGGKPTMLMLGPSQKQVFSGFTGIAVNRREVKGKDQGVIIGAADVYVSDFGTLNVVPNIFQRNRSALVVDPRMVKMATLRPMRNWALAKTGCPRHRRRPDLIGRRGGGGVPMGRLRRPRVQRSSGIITSGPVLPVCPGGRRTGSSSPRIMSTVSPLRASGRPRRFTRMNSHPVVVAEVSK